MRREGTLLSPFLIHPEDFSEQALANGQVAPFPGPWGQAFQAAHSLDECENLGKITQLQGIY